VRPDPYPLPEGFEWCVVDLNKDEEAKEVYEHLVGNYVEDTEATFRFAYPIEFLRWALTPPTYIQEWHLGVRA